MIVSEEAYCAFDVRSLTSFTYYVNNYSISDMNMETAAEIMKNVYFIDSLMSAGVSPETAVEILSAPIEYTSESLGKDQVMNFFYAYIMIFALYMVILLYGQMVATNVASEKSSRAMELLITSAKPTAMMFGKVLSACLAGLTQLVAVFGSALLFFNINKDYWGDNEIATMLLDIPPELVGFMLVFFLLGFLIYAFLFGAIGSMASKVEDINTMVTPVMLMFIFAFIVVMTSMGSGSVDSGLMKFCSFFPFTSPMAMFTRIALSTIPAYQIIISVAILAISIVGVGFVSAKIYRMGVLLYGKPPKIKEIIKMLKNSK
jgi:ABC-2 type transport system permease protein